MLRSFHSSSRVSRWSKKAGTGNSSALAPHARAIVVTMSTAKLPPTSFTLPAPLSWTTVHPSMARGRSTRAIESVVVPQATASVHPSPARPLSSDAADPAAAARVSAAEVVGTLRTWRSPKCPAIRCSTSLRRLSGSRTSMWTHPMARAWASSRDTVERETPSSSASSGVDTSWR